MYAIIRAHNIINNCVYICLDAPEKNTKRKADATMRKFTQPQRKLKNTRSIKNEFHLIKVSGPDTKAIT